MKINDYITIDDDEIKFKFVRSSGPGGQNVNKVSSAVQLSFNVADSDSIPSEIKERIKEQLKGQITKDGLILLKSDTHRAQNLNRKDVINKFKMIINKASRKRKRRIPTKPTIKSVTKRLRDKKFLGNLKRKRRKPVMDHL